MLGDVVFWNRQKQQHFSLATALLPGNSTSPWFVLRQYARSFTPEENVNPAKNVNNASSTTDNAVVEREIRRFLSLTSSPHCCAEETKPLLMFGTGIRPRQSNGGEQVGYTTHRILLLQRKSEGRTMCGQCSWQCSCACTLQF